MEKQPTKAPSRPQQPPTPRPAQASPSSLKQRYLLAYNLICFVLWSVVTLRALLLIPTLSLHGKLHAVFEALFRFLQWTQTIALLEIVHALFGLVRASPLTTALQVSSRIVVVWGVLEFFPQIVSTTNSWGRSAPGSVTGPIAFCGILTAWGITEMIRYGYFVYREGVSPTIPAWLTWLRYNTFFVLYPIGITSECLLMLLAIRPAKRQEQGLDWALKTVLLIYVPGSYILYTHMMAQRRKVLKGKTKTKTL